MSRRPIPEPIMDVIRQQCPKAVSGVIEGDEVFLLMNEEEGSNRQFYLRCIAGPDFMTAVRVCDNGGKDNFDKLMAGFRMTLLSPESVGRELIEH